MAYKIDINKKEVKRKTEQVKSTIADMKKFKTVALLDLRKLPDALLQSLRQRIRQKGGKVLVLKKPVVSRVLAANPKLAARVSECDKPMALILTDQSPLELNSFFKQHRKKRAAKLGDVAITDIVVPEGETDLPPGPALSELKAGGVNVQIKAGKIIVSKESTIAKAGEKLTEPKVKALQSLGVQPFEIMASLVFGFDGEYIYSKDRPGHGRHRERGHVRVAFPGDEPVAQHQLPDRAEHKLPARRRDEAGDERVVERECIFIKLHRAASLLCHAAGDGSWKAWLMKENEVLNMTKVDPYLHAVLVLHGAGKEVSKEGIVAVVKASGAEVDDARAKVLAEAVKGVNFEDLLKQSMMVAAAPAAAAPAAHGESKKEEKKEDEGKKEEQAAEGLASLFG